jgi:hypothetical protein
LQAAKFRQNPRSSAVAPSENAKSAKKEKKSAKILEIAPRFRYTVLSRFGGDVLRVVPKFLDARRVFCRRRSSFRPFAPVLPLY